jgi:hypothetical protein
MFCGPEWDRNCLFLITGIRHYQEGRNGSLQRTMVSFLQCVPAMEVYRASIEHEVCRPAFVTKKGSSRAKHEVGCELTCAARECSRPNECLWGSIALWGCRPANWMCNKLWQPPLWARTKENKPLSAVWDFMVDNRRFMLSLALGGRSRSADGRARRTVALGGRWRSADGRAWRTVALALGGRSRSADGSKLLKIVSFLVWSNSSVG